MRLVQKVVRNVRTGAIYNQPSSEMAVFVRTGWQNSMIFPGPSGPIGLDARKCRRDGLKLFGPGPTSWEFWIKFCSDSRTKPTRDECPTDQPRVRFTPKIQSQRSSALRSRITQPPQRHDVKQFRRIPRASCARSRTWCMGSP